MRGSAFWLTCALIKLLCLRRARAPHWSPMPVACCPQCSRLRWRGDCCALDVVQEPLRRGSEAYYVPVGRDGLQGRSSCSIGHQALLACNQEQDMPGGGMCCPAEDSIPVTSREVVAVEPLSPPS
jgi:hypothetical protein